MHLGSLDLEPSNRTIANIHGSPLHSLISRNFVRKEKAQLADSHTLAYKLSFYKVLYV